MLGARALPRLVAATAVVAVAGFLILSMAFLSAQSDA